MARDSPGSCRTQRVNRAMGVDQLQRVALPTQVILQALQQQRAAVASLAVTQFLRAHPEGPHDASVKRAPWLALAEFAAKGKAQVGDVGDCSIGSRPLKTRQVQA